MSYQITKEQLLSDLYTAYYDARRHKRWQSYQLDYEGNLDRNLLQLCEDLYTRQYVAAPSTCFVIEDPKKREVFAADFQDRIVHHLYYNYTHELYERTFIQDAYSCIPGRGTHYGIRRLEKHIRQSSLNYTQPCYVLKMDIQGYFMHIRRDLLLDVCLHSLEKMQGHRYLRSYPISWFDRIDMDFVCYLTQEIVLLNPTLLCHRKGPLSDWDNLPTNKSLFCSPIGCGLPIGNLTSQLFSNVYLNVLDQYMKRTLCCKHYGRYVDDFYVVSPDYKWLYDLVPKVRCFLQEKLGLSLHEGKTMIKSIYSGVDFLGMSLLPHHRDLTTEAKQRMHKKWHQLCESQDYKAWYSLDQYSQWFNSKASYQGVLSHTTK